jgi:hypothetical protein
MRDDDELRKRTLLDLQLQLIRRAEESEKRASLSSEVQAGHESLPLLFFNSTHKFALLVATRDSPSLASLMENPEQMCAIKPGNCRVYVIKRV